MRTGHSKYNLIFSFLISSLFFVSSVYAGTYYVGIYGDDGNGDGSSGKPWKTIAFALANATYGDTISINNGTYTEGQLVIPAGVNLTSTSQDNSKVILRPNKSMAVSTPFLKLASDSVGSDGNQTISYIELNGTNGGNTANQAILVRNRNNVRVHNCNIHDFPIDPDRYFTIQVESTQINRNVAWKEFWPADSQAPGTDRNIDALWPANPVQNFKFDHNVMKNCGAIAPFHLKNSSFHDNYIDNRSTCGWTFKGTPALMWNVDIYNNTLFGLKQSGQTAWKVELWLHRNGCEYHNNVMNGYYSITIGKETKIYENTIEMSPVDQLFETAIEFNGQSHSEVYRNFVSGAAVGIRVGADGNSLGKNFIVEHVTVRDNVFYNCKKGGVRVQADGPVTNSYTFTTRNIDIYDNIVDGNLRAIYSIVIKQHEYTETGTAILTNVNVNNNISVRHDGYAGSTVGDVSNIVIDNNTFYDNKYNVWAGSTATNTEYNNPNLADPPIVPNLNSLIPPILYIVNN